jgi:hypothetical protein
MVGAFQIGRCYFMLHGRDMETPLTVESNPICQRRQTWLNRIDQYDALEVRHFDDFLPVGDTLVRSTGQPHRIKMLADKHVAEITNQRRFQGDL